MRVWAFIALMLVTVATVVIAAEIAERWIAPGFERGIVIAVITGLVIFPLSRWFEHRGWVKGAWRPGGTGRPAVDRSDAAPAASGPATRDRGDAGGPEGAPAARRGADERTPPTGDAR